MKTSLKNLQKKTKQKNIEIIDLTDKNLFESIQIIINTTSERLFKKSSAVVKYKSNIPNIEKTIKEIPALPAVEFV